MNHENGRDEAEAGVAVLSFTSGERESVQQLRVPTGATLLQIACDEDTPLNFVCCRAACGECLMRVVRNPENLTPVSEDERHLLTAMDAEPEMRLACQCTVLGSVEIDPQPVVND